MSEPTILHTRVAVVGGGVAALAAALQAARLGLEVLVIEGPLPGGTLFTAAVVEDFPGLADGVSGPELVERMRAQCEGQGVHFLRAEVEHARLEHEPFRLDTDMGRTITADALVIATGGRARRLGVPGEEALRGYGVSECATCDGFFCRDQEVLVVGDGDTALSDALYLTEHATRVTIVFPGDEPRAQRVLIQRARAHAKIAWLPRSRVLELHGVPGEGGLDGASVVTDGHTRRLACRGLYVAVGREPVTEVVRGQLTLDAEGYIVRPDGWSAATSTPGVFAAGECADPSYRQAVTAAALGCMAAFDAARWLAANEARRSGAATNRRAG
jgi:thioredoxin reductase (NADPH)